MMHLVREAVRFFEYADLLETHHEAKIDAPSGTALAIAEAAATAKGGAFNAPAAEKELIAGTRGGDHEGVVIHSARMPGKVAHHEMVFGHVGQTLSIKHDSINRESFMPGVMLAIREIGNRPGLTIGLDKLMGALGCVDFLEVAPLISAHIVIPAKAGIQIYDRHYPENNLP